MAGKRRGGSMSKENLLRAQREFAILEPLALAAERRRGYHVDVGFIGSDDFVMHVSAAHVPRHLRKKYLLGRSSHGPYLLRHRPARKGEVQYDLGTFEKMHAFLLEFGGELCS
jgi:hypothetical protein